MARRKTTDVLSPNVDEARSQILLAAQTVFVRYGVAKTTMDDVAREVGVSRPTVYRYFKDRDALISALIEMRSRMLFGRAREVIDGYPTFDDQVVEGLVFLLEHGQRDPIVSALVNPEHMDKVLALVDGSDFATRLMVEMWEPILLAARERGDLRADVDIEAVSEWFAMLQVVLVGRRDLAPNSDPTHRALFRNFVLPALRPRPAPE